MTCKAISIIAGLLSVGIALLLIIGGKGVQSSVLELNAIWGGIGGVLLAAFLIGVLVPRVSAIPMLAGCILGAIVELTLPYTPLLQRAGRAAGELRLAEPAGAGDIDRPAPAAKPLFPAKQNLANLTLWTLNNPKPAVVPEPLLAEPSTATLIDGERPVMSRSPIRTRFLVWTAFMACTAARADWPAELEKTSPPDDYALITRAKETLIGNAVTGKAWAPYHGIMPSRGKYKGVWNWDSAFHAMAVSHWDGGLAREQIRIVFSQQQPNGALPDVIYETGKVLTSASKPPVIGWAVAVVDQRAHDDAFLKEIYPKLIKLGDFWCAERGGREDGLFYYAGADVGWDSGWDTSIRWDEGYRAAKTNDHRLWAIDLNCYMVMHYRAMAYIAGRLELPDDQNKWLAEADALAGRVNDKLWDDQQGSYVDRDRVTGKAGLALTPASFMPLFVHIAPADRAARMAKLAADPQKFFPGMPTAAYDTPGYKSSDYWRGPAWMNTSYFALKGLRDYGCVQLADAMRSTLLGWVKQDRDAIWEYYDSRNGKGGGAKFFGWSCAFSIAFVADWENDNLTRTFAKASQIPEGVRVDPGNVGSSIKNP